MKLLKLLKKLFEDKQLHTVGFYPAYEVWLLSREKGGFERVVQNLIDEHIQGEKKYTINVDKIWETFAFIRINTENYQLFEDIKTLFQSYTEPVPPWIAFPHIYDSGVLRYNQGDEEWYVSNFWSSYWLNLTDEERQSYGVKHNIPPEWIEWWELFESSIKDVWASRPPARLVKAMSYEDREAEIQKMAAKRLKPPSRKKRG